MTPTPLMHDYSVLGGMLRSQLPFPELPGAPPSALPTWTLRVVEGAAPPAVGPPRGERQIGPEWYRLWDAPDGFRLDSSYAGCFEARAGGAELIWHLDPGAEPELVRAVLLGPVMALALEMGGCLCLHGSAVAVGGEAIVFLGGKFHGKSTLATALASAGADLISDDLVVVRPGPVPTVRPGVPSVRLWEDAARRLSVAERYPSLIPGIKTTVTGMSRERVQRDLPLGAVYLLDPVHPGDDHVPAARRTSIAGSAAVVALAQQTKLPDCLIGFAEAGRQLRAAASIAGAAPLYTLHVLRDFQALEQVVSQLLGWHTRPAPLVRAARD